jgi:hypothetical protein
VRLGALVRQLNRPATSAICGRAAESNDELAPHSITSSAGASSVRGAADLLFERKRAAPVDVLIYLLLRKRGRRRRHSVLMPTSSPTSARSLCLRGSPDKVSPVDCFGSDPAAIQKRMCTMFTKHLIRPINPGPPMASVAWPYLKRSRFL